MAQGDLLGLPSDLSMLTNSDPNKRVATAVVNGFVITQTDIDQRVALLLAANERPVSEQEMIRVRMQVLRNLIDTQRSFSRARRDIGRERSLTRGEREAGRGETPSQHALARERDDRLLEALGALPDDQGQALRLKHLEGLTVDEIAARMDRSPAGVAGLMRRGMSQLRESLGGL